jgi:hypothetical protein
LVEQRIRNAKVGSSTLFTGTNKAEGQHVRVLALRSSAQAAPGRSKPAREPLRQASIQR